MLSQREIIDITVSWITISLAFAYDINPYTFLHTFPMYLVVVGTAFVLHELGHKFTAISLGYRAEYRAWTAGLVFAVIMAITMGIVFAAPGAVYVLPRGWRYPNRRENGIISLAGPMVNFLVSVSSIFLILLLHPTGYLFQLLRSVAYVNAFIGFFNMLPFSPLDGSKVLAWSPSVYTIAIIAFLGLLAFFF
jgi:Zn-dependent protease